MTQRRQAAYWLAFAVGLGLFIWLLRDMLLPFVVGMGIAYLCDPLADRLERWGLSRSQATTLITLTSLTVFIIALLLFIPLIVRQTSDLLAALPDYMERASQLLNMMASNLVEAAENRGVDVTDGNGKFALKDYASQAINFFGKLAGDVVRGGAALLNFFSLLVITPIVTFYLLLEWDRIVEKISSWLPKRHADEIRDIAGRIDRTLAGFVRGQGTVCLFLIVFYAVGLSVIGLKFGFVIGLMSGALSFIPFVGAIFGAIASIGLALVQFWPGDTTSIILVVVLYIVGQVLEGYILTPKLVGDSIGLHPVWVMFGVLAGGVLFGFVGMLLALPVSAVIGVLARYGLERYLASRLYDPDNPA
ncbi:AI-2E family transporter [Minwuia sp.]|uniref:AI-2E family transporter n=1 Tax=Minwuia sp. TaxID=2493630 RepID=UPI003A906B32